MDIKILNKFIRLCRVIGLEPTDEEFIDFIKRNYPKELSRINLDVIRRIK